jgi:hypothetical protein
MPTVQTSKGVAQVHDVYGCVLTRVATLKVRQLNRGLAVTSEPQTRQGDFRKASRFVDMKVLISDDSLN